MPYLVESVLAAVASGGPRSGGSSTPSWSSDRTRTGELATSFRRGPGRAAARHASPSRGSTSTSAARLPDDLAAELVGVLRDVREVVARRPGHARQAVGGLTGSSPTACSARRPRGGRRRLARADDVANLLRWLADGHFTFLGHRYLTAPRGGSSPRADGLGVLARRRRPVEDLTPEQATPTRAGPRTCSSSPAASAKSRVLRPVQPYYLAVRVVDGDGTGRRRAPVPRDAHRRRALRERARHPGGGAARARRDPPGRVPLESYSGQQMLEVISALPREELFGSDRGAAARHGGRRARRRRARAVRVFLRRDPYGRFTSCLVYVPRDRYTTLLAAWRWPRRPADAPRRDVRRPHGPADGVGAGARALHRAPGPGRAGRRRGAVEPVDVEACRRARRGHPHLGRPAAVAAPAAGRWPTLLPGVPEAYKADVEPAQALVDLRYSRA